MLEAHGNDAAPAGRERYTAYPEAMPPRQLSDNRAGGEAPHGSRRLESPLTYRQHAPVPGKRQAAYRLAGAEVPVVGGLGGQAGGV